MFERFNDSARRALFFARYEASRLGEHLIESRHVLLGIFRENDAVTSELWRMFNVAPREIQAEYPTIAERISSSAELPISEDVKHILAYASHEAEEHGDTQVVPCHLVLAILSIPECEAAVLLRRYHVEYELVSEIARPLMREAIRRSEIEERTPITLRSSHYQVLDRLAAAMKLGASHRENRQNVVLAIVDAVTASPLCEEPFSSLEGFRARIGSLLSAK